MASQNVTANAQLSLPPPYETLTNTQDVEDVSTVVPNQRFKVAAKITGRLQISCAVAIGLVSIITAVSCDSYTELPAIVGWGGICFYLVAGILGIKTAGHWKNCTIVTYMVMSILAAMIAGGQICIESIAATQGGCYYDNDYSTFEPAMHGMAAVIAFVEMVSAIVAAAFCCHGVCYHPTKIITLQVFHQPPVINFQPSREAQRQRPYQEFNAPPRAAYTSTAATAPPQYEKIV